MAHNFNHQTNITLGESIKMGVKAPALEDRIFDTWSDANTYIHDENSSAVNGLVLTVINDGENNGGWFVDKRQINNSQYELILTRIGTGGGMPTLTWRTPTKDEWSYLCLYRSASKVYDSTLGDYVSNARYISTQINGINGLMLLPDVFELPSGITMNNINVNSSQYIGNIYTVSQWEELEGAGCVFLPCGGSRSNISVQGINENGFYWSVNDGYPDESITDSWAFCFNPYLYLTYRWKSFGHSVRLIKDEQSGNFTISEHDNKCNIAKSNLQFHCKNKEWRFAENAYDIIGSDNTNIAENYDGWIDLFGYGTSGWNSGFNAYQPWSTSDNYLDYISYDLTGEYVNADWGIYNMSYDSLATVAFTGNYNDLENKPTIPAAQIQSDWAQTDSTQVDYIKNKPDVASLEDNIEDLQEDVEELQNGYFILGWRTPTADEWDYIINTRSASTVSGTANARYAKAQVNGINGLILLPDVFELPTGITMLNINTDYATASGNTYTISQWETLENAGCIFLPCSGYRTRTTMNNINSFGFYSSTTQYDSDDIGYLFIHSGSSGVFTRTDSKRHGKCVRLIKENTTGGFSISSTLKANIAKSNLQFHCLNKEWRFAPNAYDVIGNDNSNIAENYNGYIDLFGFGTSGWNSGAVCYQPWSSSTNNADYINHDLIGDYANADWGVYIFRKQLQPVAFSGSYNDLSNKPIIPVGIPSGGNAGQVLSKASATDYDVHWNNQVIIYPSAYCTTNATSADKKASCSLYTLSPNSYVHVLLGTTNTVQSALTLNINSTGAKPIYINGNPSSSTNYTLPAGTYIVFYNGTNYYFRTDGKLTTLNGAFGGSYNDLTNKPAAIPTPTSADADKLLSVNSSGEYELITIINSELIPY